MKKISILILALLVAMAACKKVPEVNKEYVDVERDLITVGTTTATIQCDYEYIATLKKAYLYYGEGEEATEMTTDEMRVVQNTLYVDLAGLKENTTYSYYYEFVNGFNSMKSAVKTFKTESDPEGGGSGNVPIGVINGKFSVGEGQQLYFSQGNLQYQASTNTWRFAEHQWDYVGNGWSGTVYENDIKCNNFLISPTYNGWIDLFGWGTSGYNHGAICYQPWSTSRRWADYYPYGQSTYNLYDQTGEADWGCNPIANGGNTPNVWRTLTREEWIYLFNTRSTSSGIRYAKAIVNEVKGIILLPDNWSTNTYTLNSTNQSDVDCNSNIINSTQWSILENAGAVFLPAAGGRYGVDTVDVNYGRYWSSSSSGETTVFLLDFCDAWLYLDHSGHHYYGQSVRLVYAVQ